MVEELLTFRHVDAYLNQVFGGAEYATSTADPNTSPSSADLTSRGA
jgi:hypothetical protein